MKFLSRDGRLAFYERQLLGVTARILSATDRCPVSASSGSMDREYWAWSSKDFSNMDMQRGVLCLAYVYRTEFEGNLYYRRPALLEWIKMSVRFWIERQGRLGGFDHLYIHEESWMAAAFTLLDMVEAYGMIHDEVDAALRDRWLSCMMKAGGFLVKYDETHGFISNHRVGAAAALLGLAGISGRQDFETRAQSLLKEVQAKQSSEGWHLEYEGADPGYQTLGIHYLARASKFSGDPEWILASAGKALGFISHFMHPDGSMGGEYGSRGCPHFFPGGIEYFSSFFPVSESLASAGVSGLAGRFSAGLADADPRNEVPLATSYVHAHIAASERRGMPEGRAALPAECEGEFMFKEAGLFVKSSRSSYLVFGASKGGTLKVFSKHASCELLYSDCGYAGQLGGHEITSHLYMLNPRMESGEGFVSVEAPFFRFRRERTMGGLQFLLFRLFNHTLGRVRTASDFMRRHVIIGLFLKMRKPAGLSLKRRVSFIGESGIKVEDSIDGYCKGKALGMKRYGFISTVYMASARYFRRQDFNQAWESSIDLQKDIEPVIVHLEMNADSGTGHG